jgi:hypothetical protein
MQKNVTIALLVTAIVMPCDFSLAKGHPAVKPSKREGIATCQGKGLVGNWVFSLSTISATNKEPANLATSLEFAQGQPPSGWWARSYFTCTLKEAIVAIRSKSRNYSLETRVTLTPDERPFFKLRSDITKDTENWDTTGFEGANVSDKLRGLAPGTYTLTFVRQLDYEIPIKIDEDVRWDGRWLILAEGTLTVLVK